MLEEVQRVFDSSGAGYEREDEARAAVASALWVMYSRRGEAEKAQTARHAALELAASSYVSDEISPLFGQRAMIAAAAELNQLGDVAPRLAELPAHTLPFELVDALVCSKELGAAVELVKQSNQPPWLLARLARRAPEGPRTTEWIALAERAEDELDELFDEGLYTPEEVRDTRLELAALRGEQGAYSARLLASRRKPRA